MPARRPAVWSPILAAGHHIIDPRTASRPATVGMAVSVASCQQSRGANAAATAGSCPAMTGLACSDGARRMVRSHAITSRRWDAWRSPVPVGKRRLPNSWCVALIIEDDP